MNETKFERVTMVVAYPDDGDSAIDYFFACTQNVDEDMVILSATSETLTLTPEGTSLSP
jgi:hypothetical protein|tara:strand:+ start:561 stop:737 length:177 start_codon:yes stop_codon:yes gene_type:complete